jgi:hypothetical protein
MSRSLMFGAVILCSMLSQAIAQPGDCYRAEQDVVRPHEPRWTLTEAEGWELIWDRGGDKVTLITGSAGSGIPVRTAVEPDGKTMHIYRMVRGVLVFDMVVYEPGCQ